jgi:hypothetical protein
LLYNVRRPHSSLDGMTPDQAYFTPLPLRAQPNPGRRSTYRRGKVVQTTGTSFDLGGVLVDASQLVPEIGEAGPGTSPTYPEPIMATRMTRTDPWLMRPTAWRRGVIASLNYVVRRFVERGMAKAYSPGLQRDDVRRLSRTPDTRDHGSIIAFRCRSEAQ